jgi:DNA polymerase-4
VFVPRAATILHADLDAFYASVAQRDDPALRGRPVIVGPGVVLAASYEARARGVRSAMSAGKARRLCPDAVVVECNWEAYGAASKAVFAVFADTSPIVEKLSIDEAFLDVRGLERISGAPEEIAARLRARVREDVGLPLSVGVAASKLVAKVASNEAKPDGLLVVPAGSELDFLHPLGVRKLWGVGAATAERLHGAGIETVGEAAARSEDELIAVLGSAGGRRLHAMAFGRDRRRVRAGRGRRSFGAQSALGRRGRSADELDAVLVGLVDRVTRRMRAKGTAGRSVTLRLRFSDFSRATRSHTLPRPTSQMAAVLAALRLLLTAAMPMIEKRGVTLLGVTISGLERGEQLELPLDGHDPQVLDATVDDVRDRFGTDAVKRAKLL